MFKLTLEVKIVITVSYNYHQKGEEMAEQKPDTLQDLFKTINEKIEIEKNDRPEIAETLVELKEHLEKITAPGYGSERRIK